MYQALYRKWRPKTFDEVVGQEHITEILKKQVLLDRTSHAYLFTGTRGTGKTTCAKILAKAVNCENPVGGNPCGRCPACVGIDNGSILDVTEMDAASNNGVDNVRALRDEAIYTPATVKKRVYIIDEVHMMSSSAFNALLKIMEEPPEHLIFILATTELHKVPATVLSRCQRYSFRRIPQQIIKDRLMQISAAEDMKLTDEAASLLSRLADGSVRDALSLLDQCSAGRVDTERVLSVIGIAENDEICSLFSAVTSGDADTALDILDRLYGSGKDVASVLEQLAALHRDILLGRIAPKGGANLMSGGFTDENLKVGRDTGSAKLLAALETIHDTLSQLARSSDRRLSCELCLMKLCGLRSEPAAVPALPEARPVPAAKKPTAAGADSEPPKPGQTATPVPEAEDKPPVIPPEPEKPPKAEDKADGLTWKSLLTALEKELEVYNYMLLADETHAEGIISDGTVTVLAKSRFSMSQLNTAALIEQIRTTASALAGKPVRVKVELFEEKDAGKFDKLDSFMNEFGIEEDK